MTALSGNQKFVYDVFGTTVANIMRRNGLNPSGERLKGGMSWSEFIKIHKDVIWATDFFTVEVWTPFGLVTYYVLFLKPAKLLLAELPPIRMENG